MAVTARERRISFEKAYLLEKTFDDAIGAASGRNGVEPSVVRGGFVASAVALAPGSDCKTRDLPLRPLCTLRKFGTDSPNILRPRPYLSTRTMRYPRKPNWGKHRKMFRQLKLLQS